MTDLALIGLRAESKEIAQGAKDLDKLNASAKKADAANDNMKKGNEKVVRSQKKVVGTTTQATSKFNVMSFAMRKAAIVAGALGIAMLAVFNIKASFGFVDALAEVSKLVDTALPAPLYWRYRLAPK